MCQSNEVTHQSIRRGGSNSNADGISVSILFTVQPAELASKSMTLLWL